MSKSKSPRKGKSGKKLFSETLEALRLRRDIAARRGNWKAALAAATAIDKKRGLYE